MENQVDNHGMFVSLNMLESAANSGIILDRNCGVGGGNPFQPILLFEQT